MTVPLDLRRAAPDPACAVAIDDWFNEGGAIASLPAVRRSTLSRRKRPEDTAEGCRDHAADDLRRAAALTGDHIRWRFEHSAAAWTARAEMLGRIEAKFQARAASLRA